MELTSLYRAAAKAQLVRAPDANAHARARCAYRRNLAEPGDCAGNDRLLRGLAIAFAEIGYRPGWIPEVQCIGAQIATLAEQLEAETMDALNGGGPDNPAQHSS